MLNCTMHDTYIKLCITQQSNIKILTNILDFTLSQGTNVDFMDGLINIVLNGIFYPYDKKTMP